MLQNSSNVPKQLFWYNKASLFSPDQESCNTVSTRNNYSELYASDGGLTANLHS